MKKKKVSTSRKKAWEWFSRYIRLRDTLERGSGQYVKCCTCDTVKHWKEMQAGHFIPQAQGNAVRFDERNVHAQCYRCNMNLGGNGPEYYPFMVELYGEEIINELKLLSKTTVKFTASELDDIAADYKARAECLMNEV
jgi:5-methylcytosine-specific restriction endonuclease McrA